MIAVCQEAHWTEPQPVWFDKSARPTFVAKLPVAFRPTNGDIAERVSCDARKDAKIGSRLVFARQKSLRIDSKTFNKMQARLTCMKMGQSGGKSDCTFIRPHGKMR
jgi:hypothetical protein